jgi:hypothetical protein
MPVSVTVMSTSGALVEQGATDMMTRPVCVNFSELPTRLQSTCAMNQMYARDTNDVDDNKNKLD